jgi:hypothetical protein
MPHGYFFDTSTNIAVTTDSNTFSTVFNTDYPGNQITGFQLNGVDIGLRITPFVDLSFSTANNYHYLINNNNINTTFSFTKPKPRVAVTNCASISNMTLADGDYTLYEFHHGSTGTFQLNSSIPNIVLDLNVLLIGGGGAGGQYYNNYSGGAGGGGAGSYVTTTIKAPVKTSSFTDIYFDINVGAGGAGTGTGNTSGLPGGPSIITYVSKPSIGNATYYSLTAAGGGSGGSLSKSQGIFDLFNINGSTGGACGSIYSIQYYNAYGTNAGYTNDNGSIFTEIACSVHRGGNAVYVYGGGGGGGAGGPGHDVSSYPGGNGGDGKTWINGVTYAGGGGGGPGPGGSNNVDSIGGSGGGGKSAVQYQGNYGDALPNSGGGGGAAWTNSSGNGGSGICIIAVKTSDAIAPPSAPASECAIS